MWLFVIICPKQYHTFCLKVPSTNLKLHLIAISTDKTKLINFLHSLGQHLMTGMQEVFSRAVNTTPSDQQESLREAMSTLRNSWDQLNMDLNSVTAQLKALVARWEDFHDSRSKLDGWLTDTEHKLAEKCDTKAELGEMKTLLERYISYTLL